MFFVIITSEKKAETALSLREEETLFPEFHSKQRSEMTPLIRALSFLTLLLCFQVQGAYLFEEYQEYPDDFSEEKKDNSADKKTQCNQPLAPEFGKVLVVGNFLEVDSRAIFTCEEGREMVGSMRSKCLDSLEWSFPPPKCFREYYEQVSRFAVRKTSHNHLNDSLRGKAVGRPEASRLFQVEVARGLQVAKKWSCGHKINSKQVVLSPERSAKSTVEHQYLHRITIWHIVQDDIGEKRFFSLLMASLLSLEE
ncbi:hypothetical protein TNCV_1428461 [Trichonephila clavipes]|nr:hypothetical protein TNCV_1428461 [Trichonephila clavipes]